MNLSFNSHLRVELYFLFPLLSNSMFWGKKIIASLLPYQMRAAYRNFFISCWRASSVLLKPYFSINYYLIPVYHVRISEE